MEPKEPNPPSSEISKLASSGEASSIAWNRPSLDITFSASPNRTSSTGPLPGLGPRSHASISASPCIVPRSSGVFGETVPASLNPNPRTYSSSADCSLVLNHSQ